MKETKFAIKSVIDMISGVAVFFYTSALLVVKGFDRCLKGLMQYI